MSETNERDQTSSAVWYFVGATFILTVPNLMFHDLAWWARIGFMLLGFGVMIAGFAQWRRELTQNRRSTDPQEPDGGDGPESPPRASE